MWAINQVYRVILDGVRFASIDVEAAKARTPLFNSDWAHYLPLATAFRVGLRDKRDSGYIFSLLRVEVKVPLLEHSPKVGKRFGIRLFDPLGAFRVQPAYYHRVQ